MSLVATLTRGAVIATAAGVLYATAGGLLPFNKEERSVEPGFANPKYATVDKPVNENGNIEHFLVYDDGKVKVSLPIMEGPYGPLVGDAGYHWRSMGVEIKSSLVYGSWGELTTTTRKAVLKNELEKMIENYGE